MSEYSDLMSKYKKKKPEVVFEWNDEETGARGWVVINSLRGGAAGGGTRMRKGLTKDEVESLAKVMEIKFSVSGPAIGGAKSGIDFDPADPRKDLVLQKWFTHVIPLLKNYYGTGGDLNVDEIKDVIPVTEKLGLLHPQEGVVKGHFKNSSQEQQIEQLRLGVSKVVTDTNYSPDPAQHYLVADLITGYGVSESVRHFYSIYKNDDLKDKRVLVQGWGNVAGAAAYYLAQNGAKIVGIIDRSGGLIKPEGYSFEEVRQLLLNRKANALNEKGMLSFEEVNQLIWDTPVDIFIPAAASKIVSRDQLDRMLKAGLQTVSCGANVPFVDEDIFFGENAAYADANLSLIPDFIANCGMARTFAYLMGTDATLTDEAIFRDVSDTMERALTECHKLNADSHKLASTALSIALRKLN